MMSYDELRRFVDTNPALAAFVEAIVESYAEFGRRQRALSEAGLTGYRIRLRVPCVHCGTKLGEAERRGECLVCGGMQPPEVA